MSSPELVFDNSKEVFQLDRQTISFKLNIENISESEPLKLDLKSETEIKITNLTDNFLAFRVKTTKKLYYSVNPTYCVIPSKEIKSIKIIFLIKEGEIPKLHGHKFKFEAFIINENEKDKDPKDLFSEYIKKGAPVTGNSHKTFVQFSDEVENSSENHKKSRNFLTLPKVSHIRSGSNLSDYQDLDEKNENDNEKKPLLSEQIKSNEEQKPVVSDIITNGKIESGEIKNEVKEEKENIKKKNNDNSNIENNNSKIENNNSKIEKNNSNIEKNNGNIENNNSNIENDNKSKICKILRKLMEGGRNDVPDILVFFALFVAMLSGYYLVK